MMTRNCPQKGATANIKAFRTWIEYLGSKGLLFSVRKRVSTKYQLGALTSKLDGQGAVFFHNVGDYNIPVVSNLCFDRSCFAYCMGVDEKGVVERIIQAIENPRPCIFSEEAAFKENILKKGFDLLRDFPIPTYHEDDAGPFITGGIVVVRDPENRKINVSIHRLQVLGKDRLGILMLPRHLNRCYEKAKEIGKPLKIAIAIGVDPLTLLASQTLLEFGVNELEVASNLHGEEGLQVTTCITEDILVPVESEIVIEGEILMQETALEGPFGEYPRYYSLPEQRPVVKVECVSYRNNPIYYSILPASREHLLLGGVAREASLLRSIRGVVPSVRCVHLTPGGSCRYHLVISIEKKMKVK